MGGREVAAIDLGSEGGSMNRRIDPPGKAERTTLSVYDGQVCVGEIIDQGRGRVVAYETGKGRRIKIGTFANRSEAMRAIIGGRS